MGEAADESAGSGNDGARVFINHMRLEVTLSEVRIDVGQVAAGAAEPDVKGRFVTSPDYLAGMRQRIGCAVDLYETRFGAIAEGGLAGEIEAKGRG
ncbi:MAG: hypothetical protein JO013_10215 [Alphaproteobacteria bacterium]|nr:hypothetical protein [Alphaproteobacteria bacterium]